jgi:hypothetical protein
MNHGRHGRIGLVVMLCAAFTSAWADDNESLALDPASIDLAQAIANTATLQPSDGQGEIPEAKARPAFGETGSTWITIGAAVANDLDDATDYNVHIAWSRFIDRNIEFAIETAAWHFDQPGDNAVGLNASILFRWHIYPAHKENWSVYLDGGIGALVATDQVPDGGTSFDFTPRFGAGVTRRLGDSGARLQAGVRWHHISNARITGDHNNPARDAPLVYIGVMIPF